MERTRRMLLLPMRTEKRQHTSLANPPPMSRSIGSGAERRRLAYAIRAAIATHPNGVVVLKVRERCAMLVACILPSSYVVERSSMPMRLPARLFRLSLSPNCGSRRTWTFAHQALLP